mmetsp:Transcript_538/g.1524  ORF Transcript_538/g.1524 Transcript_538/m.1524 type:complete len:711 (-) Transcript_538:884-3016(-)
MQTTRHLTTHQMCNRRDRTHALMCVCQVGDTVCVCMCVGGRQTQAETLLSTIGAYSTQACAQFFANEYSKLHTQPGISVCESDERLASQEALTHAVSRVAFSVGSGFCLPDVESWAERHVTSLMHIDPNTHPRVAVLQYRTIHLVSNMRASLPPAVLSRVVQCLPNICGGGYGRGGDAARATGVGPPNKSNKARPLWLLPFAAVLEFLCTYLAEFRGDVYSLAPVHVWVALLRVINAGVPHFRSPMLLSRSVAALQYILRIPQLLHLFLTDPSSRSAVEWVTNRVVQAIHQQHQQDDPGASISTANVDRQGSCGSLSSEPGGGFDHPSIATALMDLLTNTVQCGSAMAAVTLSPVVTQLLAAALNGSSAHSLCNESFALWETALRAMPDIAEGHQQDGRWLQLIWCTGPLCAGGMSHLVGVMRVLEVTVARWGTHMPQPERDFTCGLVGTLAPHVNERAALRLTRLILQVCLCWGVDDLTRPLSALQHICTSQNGWRAAVERAAPTEDDEPDDIDEGEHEHAILAASCEREEGGSGAKTIGGAVCVITARAVLMTHTSGSSSVGMSFIQAAFGSSDGFIAAALSALRYGHITHPYFAALTLAAAHTLSPSPPSPALTEMARQLEARLLQSTIRAADAVWVSSLPLPVVPRAAEAQGGGCVVPLGANPGHVPTGSQTEWPDTSRRKRALCDERQRVARVLTTVCYPTDRPT